METNDIIKELREECSHCGGSRGIFYENFGSSISSSLCDIAEVLEISKVYRPELTKRLANSLYRGY